MMVSRLMPMCDISDAVPFTTPNHADDILKQCYPKSYGKVSPMQLYPLCTRNGSDLA
jgi:hypothetical protein